MSTWNDEQLSLVLAEVVRRASVDEEFRALALKDSAAAIEQVSGNAAPSELKFVFLDNSTSTKYFPLPDLIPGMEELSEAELQAIAGGDWTVSGGGSSSGGGTVSGGASWHR